MTGVSARIQDEDLIPQVSLSKKKILMQKKGHKSNLILDNATHESKEVAKAQMPGEVFEERL